MDVGREARVGTLGTPDQMIMGSPFICDAMFRARSEDPLKSQLDS
jgi:hypothetical protein